MKLDTPKAATEHRWFGRLVAAAFLLPVAVIVVPGNALTTPWSAGNDTQGYVLLAQNLVSGSGYTYAHEPGAFLAPGYIETNSSTRLALGSEVEMNRRAWHTAPQSWSQIRNRFSPPAHCRFGSGRRWIALCEGYRASRKLAWLRLEAGL